MTETTLAAVDLGSNSFHAVIAQHVDGDFRVIDKLRERVRLAAGLDAHGNLTDEAQTRALAALQRIGQRLSELHANRVRVVGTNTLRKATRAVGFRAKVEAALGHPLEIISGREEARLVYRGVTHGIADDGQPRLVVDIGGGSTECIIGRGPRILRADSLFMGCVSYSQRYFAGRITEDRMEQAIIAARLELGPIHRAYKTLGWGDVHGSSGTIKAIQRVSMENGWADHAITRESLDKIYGALLAAGDVSKLSLPGLKPDRVPVIEGGFAVLMAVFRSLKLDRMRASDSALREGVLYELAGRRSAADIRQDTMRRLAQRHGVDEAQADRVIKTTLDLLAHFAEAWNLDHDTAGRYLCWAGLLHEIGTAISFPGFHKHGAYIIENSDLAGFSRGGQAQLAALVLCSRRKIDSARVQALVGGRAAELFRWVVPLRLAMLLNRTRSPRPRPTVGVDIEDNKVRLTFPAGWLEPRPLTRADLAAEAAYLAAVKIELSWG